ncbi:precorrin-2 C(20)-methyltransferase [Lutibacter sp. HS1-25]|uniref:precorrin-2 C(20)-methyltransferase n=1 Tax=Lutibacter sp. HS1-25 TaxID=2485000 RepID=UPI0010122C7E|nr:precorrin-2 C(20)-methyltransferase [Lutibacter sp. HS1-25]RXP61342.1 precorrin-2 C(20)-methyltransferase [Lutibacter sp. HS1-25]
MKKKAIIYGVSLGPGDPDLITLKGLKILQEADKIYYPGSLFKSGLKSSYSLSILEHYKLDTTKFEGFYLEMDLTRVKVNELYDLTFEKIIEDYNKDLKIAIVSEGDVNTFSSFSYLLEKIKKENFNVKLIPGITSFALAAAENLAPLCLQNEKLIILPRVQTETELEEALTHFNTVVLMKIKTVMNVINNVLSKGNYSIYYSEKLGTTHQFITSNLEEINKRDIPYFSLITIKK